MVPFARRNKQRRSKVVSEIPKAPSWTAVSRISPFAPRIVTSLVYCEIVSITMASGPGNLDYQFNLNSLFDPDITGAGHQPKGFDQLSTLYARYRVYAVRYHVSYIVNLSTDQNVAFVVAPTNSSSGYANLTSPREVFQSKYNISTFYTPRSVSGMVNLPQLNGKSRESYAADDTTAGTTTTSPSEVLSLHCVSAIQNTAVSQSANLSIKLEFLSEFWDPYQLAQS